MNTNTSGQVSAPNPSTPEATRTVAEVLRRALEVFGPNGEHWTQYAEHDGRGNFCSYGAVRKIIPYRDAEGETALKAITCLREVLGQHQVAMWNDAPERTFAEVKALFEKAISKAKRAQ